MRKKRVFYKIVEIAKINCKSQSTNYLVMTKMMRKRMKKTIIIIIMISMILFQIKSIYLIINGSKIINLEIIKK
jgi:hypothetical protein